MWFDFRYFNEALTIQENSIVAISNQAHCYVRQNLPDKVHSCLKLLISLTSSSSFIHITKESYHMSNAKTDLAIAYSIFSLNNAAKRMFESALQYNSDNLHACYGLSRIFHLLARHENRTRKEVYVKTSQDLLKKVLLQEPSFLPSLSLSVEILAGLKSTTTTQIDTQISGILKNFGEDAKALRDFGAIKIERREFDGPLGAIPLIQRSLGVKITSLGMFMLGKAIQMQWHADFSKRRRKKRVVFNKEVTGGSLEDVKEECIGEGNGVDENSNKSTSPLTEEMMLRKVQGYYATAVKKSYQCDVGLVLELGIISGRLNETRKATDLLLMASKSEITSIQEKAFRHLAIFCRDYESVSRYLKEVLVRQVLVKLSESEKRELYEKMWYHAEETLAEHGYRRAFEWIKYLVDNGYHRVDELVELYNREAPEPIRGVCGEVILMKRAYRKHSRSRMT